ncbi:MAG TPA: hypothetical protein DHW64_03955 [Chitinophagaceae bacterium]|nr:hypothetical protein [Chitinophagaceae bacterium]
MKQIKNLVGISLFTVLMACNSSEGEGNVQLNQPAPALQPVATAAPTATDTNKVSTMQPQQAAVALNPAHGLPGHRCDIAVGAPLNSPANAGGPAPVQIQTPQTNAPVMQQAPANGAGVRLNPPHGQPGHDCSIEVGKPLRQQ